MRTSIELDLLEKIYIDMQALKSINMPDDRRVSIKEFAKRMNVSVVTLYDKIKKGEIKPPSKDGRFNYYLNSYVNSVVTS